MKFFDSIFDVDLKDEYLVSGLNKELNSLYIYEYFKMSNKNVLVLANSLFEANDFYNRLSCYTDKVLFFPMDDFIASEATAISPEFMIERLNTLNKLTGDDKYIVVTNLMGILRFLPSRTLYKDKIINIKNNDDFDRDKFIYNLYDLGYEKVPVVIASGKNVRRIQRAK